MYLKYGEVKNRRSFIIEKYIQLQKSLVKDFRMWKFDVVTI